MITFYLHILIVVCFLLLPLLPSKYMYIIRWIPMVIIIIWILYDGCPLTHIDKEIEGNQFIKSLVNPFIKLSNSRIYAIMYYYVFIIFVLCTEKYYKF